ncbi:MAG: tape measure protein [Pseudomonadota bacterium]
MNGDLNVALKITAKDQTGGAVDRIRQSVEKVRGATRELGHGATSAGAEIKRGMGDGSEGARRLADAIATARQQLSLLVAGLFSLNAMAGLTRYADQWNTLQSRLKLATQTQHEFNTASEQVFAIAQRTRTGLEATVSLYGKLQAAVRGLGGEQQDALALTEAISQSFAISGTEAGAASGAILQLGQALASGALRGDEFNSVMEASPRLMQAIADGMGVPIGALRKMAEEGKLTAEAVVQALLTQKDKLAAEYAQMPQTVGGAFQQLQNAIMRYVGEADQATGASKTLAAAIIALSQNLDLLAKAIGALLLMLGGAWIARMAGAVRAAGGLLAVLGKLRGGLLGLAAFAAVDMFSSIISGWEKFKQSLADERAAQIAENRLRTIEIITKRVADGTASAADIQFLALLKSKQAWEEFTNRLPFTVDQLRQVEGAAKTLADQIGQRLAEATARAGELLKTMGQDAQTGLQALQQALDARLQAIQSHYDQRRQIIESSDTGELQKIRQLGELERQTANERIAAVRQWADQSLAIVKQTSDAQVQLARAAGQETAAIEQQSIQQRIAIYSRLEQGYRGVIDRLIQEEARLAQAANAIANERVLHAESIEDMLRALRQRGMTDYQAYMDRQAQAQEKLAQANAALAEGNIERAKRLADQAASLVNQNAQKVVDANGRVLVSQQQAIAAAEPLVRKASAIWDAAAKAQEETTRKQQQQTQELLRNLSSSMDQVAQKLQDLRGLQDINIKAKLEADTEEASALTREIETLRNLREVAIRVQSNAADVQRDIEALVKSANDIDNQEIKLNLKADADSLRASLRELKAGIEQGNEYGLNLSANMDMQVAEGAVLMLSQNMDAQLQNPRKVNLDKAEAEAILARLKEPTQSTHRVNPDTSAAEAAIANLQRPTSSTHTVYVRQVQTHASGGPILALARGGALPRFRRILPGKVSGPGTATSDSIPAMLSAGEYVIRAASVRKYGHALLAAINQGLLPKSAIPRFASGGFLSDAGRSLDANLPQLLAIGPRVSASNLNVTVQMPRDTVRVEASINGQRATLFGARDQANALANALRNLSRGLG